MPVALSPQMAQYVLIPWVGEVETPMTGVCPSAPILSSGESESKNNKLHWFITFIQISWKDLTVSHSGTTDYMISSLEFIIITTWYILAALSYKKEEKDCIDDNE